ncbi:predicted protein [Histoplasma capsulatum H143]|uniref:Uncharacterized protein n=1 Tax=Ajellomyces capsulatus (strain H143) TaxID=544712 RepID=C6HTC8_AJECH|nr:predicted protein [Histoplasma capsulatum H143]
MSLLRGTLVPGDHYKMDSQSYYMSCLLLLEVQRTTKALTPLSRGGACHIPIFMVFPEGSFEQDRSPYSVVSHSRFDCCIPSSKNEKASENEIQAHQRAYSLVDVVGRSSHISPRHLYVARPSSAGTPYTTTIPDILVAVGLGYEALFVDELIASGIYKWLKIRTIASG